MPDDVTGMSAKRRLREQKQRMAEFQEAQERQAGEWAVALANAEDAVARAIRQAVDLPERVVH